MTDEEARHLYARIAHLLHTTVHESTEEAMRQNYVLKGDDFDYDAHYTRMARTVVQGIVDILNGRNT